MCTPPECGEVVYTKDFKIAPQNIGGGNGESKDLEVDAKLGIDGKATLRQIGGDHYKKLRIQPMRYSMENQLDPLQHTVIKYVTRFRDKGGVQDLEKAKHCIDMLIQYELTGSLD